MRFKKLCLTSLSKMYKNFTQKCFRHFHRVGKKYNNKYQVTGLSLKLKSTIFFYFEHLFEMIRK